MEDLGQRLRAARVYSGKTQAEIASKLGVDPGTLGRWEDGHLPDRLKWPAIIDTVSSETKVLREWFTIDWGLIASIPPNPEAPLADIHGLHQEVMDELRQLGMRMAKLEAAAAPIDEDAAGADASQAAGEALDIENAPGDESASETGGDAEEGSGR